MRRLSWIVLAAPLSLPLGCFDPEGGRLDPTVPTPTTTDDPTTAAGSEGTTTGASATSSTNVDSSSTTDDGGTTVSLDGTTDPGSTSDPTTLGTTDGGSSSDGGSSEGSSSTGPMACVPGPEEVEFESLGDFISQGDAWQSFTADTNGEIVQVDFYWNLSGTNDSFTLELYEGEGTGGMLLHSQLFPGQGMGTFVGFDDINVLSTPVPITAGTVYTVRGLDTFGWQAANGAIPGATSSLGPGQHKNIRVWVEPCL